MSNMKKRRIPSDRAKLHALLEKREQDLCRLQEEVKDLRMAVTEADHTAIHETADQYNVTPEQLREMLDAIRSGHPVSAELLNSLNSVKIREKPEEKEMIPDDQDE